jgi:3-deoxy-manno-octulosonate cytidylyltransferase (CMP-KDO synthetase)
VAVWIVIPARFGSRRFPGKALAPLRGAGGVARSLIRRSWDAARQVAGVDRVVVATEDARIEAEARGFGAEVAMTSGDCANGTERCAEALARLGGAAQIVVNFQGDAPLTPPWFVEALIGAMRARPAIGVATPVLRCDAETVARLRADLRAGRAGATTAVFGRDGRALYFSKAMLPGAGGGPVFLHVGIYAFRPDALARYAALPVGPLERGEGLEQLRLLENGEDVLCVEVAARGARFSELNNPGDVAPIERILAERGSV